MNRALSLFLSFLLFCGCSRDSPSPAGSDLNEWMQPNGRLKVLSTTAMIEDIVRQVGGGRIDSITLIRGELDPHSYQLVKGDDEKLSFASIIFANGLGLEHGPSLARYLHGSSKAVALGNRIAEEDPALILTVDGQVDPHIWMDISLWMRTVPVIVEALSRTDPTNASLYRENGQRLFQEMQQAHETIRDQLRRIPEAQRYLVSSHDAFNYFTRSYLAAEGEDEFQGWRMRFAAPEGLAPDSQLSSIDIQKILDHLFVYHVRVIFPESNVSRDSLWKIVQAGKEKGLEVIIADDVLYGDAMGRPGSDGDTYLKMLQHNANTIEKFLRKNR